MDHALFLPESARIATSATIIIRIPPEEEPSAASGLVPGVIAGPVTPFVAAAYHVSPLDVAALKSEAIPAALLAAVVVEGFVPGFCDGVPTAGEPVAP